MRLQPNVYSWIDSSDRTASGRYNRGGGRAEGLPGRTGGQLAEEGYLAADIRAHVLEVEFPVIGKAILVYTRSPSIYH